MHFLRFGFGSAILAMPKNFKESGLIFGMVSLYILALICAHCIYLVVKCSHILERRVRNPCMGFADLGEISMKTGPGYLTPYAKYFGNYINTLQLTNMFLASCISFVFITNNIYELVNNLMDNDEPNIDLRIYMCCLFVPSLIINSLSSLKCLSPFTIIANLCYAVALSFIFWYMLHSIPSISDRVWMGQLNDLYTSMPATLYIVSVVVIVLPLENTMKYPEHFIGPPGIFYISYGIIVVFDGLIGFFGYWRYGEHVRDAISLNLPEND